MKGMTKIFVRFYILLNLFIWILPNFNSVDIIGSQWLYLSFLNLLGISFVYKSRKVEDFRHLIKSPIIICFGLLFLWAMLSFLYASNGTEVLIESARLFSLMILLINFSYCLVYEEEKVKFISNILVACLFIEVFFVLIPTYNINDTLVGLSRGQINKGIAANINITAFSILLKIPFAILILRRLKTKFFKIILFFLLTSSFYTIFILGTRAALLGSILILVVSSFFSLLMPKFKKFLINTILLIFSFLAPFLFNHLTQKNYNNNNGVVDRLGSLVEYSADSSVNERISYYKLSIETLINSPFIGMGYGNWKIESIPYVLKDKNTYTVPYHSHNDFLQMAAELGLVGLMLYISIFGFAFYMLYKLFKARVLDIYITETIFLFLLIYLIDANLNFPISRVIIQVVLILVFSYLIVEYSKISKTTLGNPLIKYVWILLLILSPLPIYSNYKVFKSFQQQTKLLADFNSRQFTGDINEIGSFEIEYPNIGVTALPLKAMVANYYSVIDPEKAIELALKSSKDNPYVYLGEVLASRIYSMQGNLENAKKYAKIAYENAPTVEIHAATYLPFLRVEKDLNELKKISELIKKSNSRFIWEYYFLSLLNSKVAMNNFDKELLQIGVNRFPEFQRLIQFNLMKDYSKEDLTKAMDFDNKANELYAKKKYLSAAEEFKKALSVIPTEKAYLENVAKSYMNGNKNDLAIKYFNKLITEFEDNSGMPEYYIGVMYYEQNELNKSCKTLLKSIQKGFSSARKFYDSVCLKN